MNCQIFRTQKLILIVQHRESKATNELQKVFISHALFSNGSLQYYFNVLITLNVRPAETEKRGAKSGWCHKQNISFYT